MFPKKLQAIAVNFDGTPGMGVNQWGKLKFSLFKGHLIRAAVKIIFDPAHSARVGVNSLVAFALKFEHPQVTLVKLIKSICFCWFHGILLSYVCPKLGR